MEYIPIVTKDEYEVALEIITGGELVPFILLLVNQNIEYYENIIKLYEEQNPPIPKEQLKIEFKDL